MIIRKRNLIASMIKNASVTSKIIFFNVVVFIVLYFLGLMFPVTDYLALVPEKIIHGSYLWTLVTSIFVHAGFAHLFFNMFSLFFIGSFVERIVGRKRFVWFYLIAGIVGGIFFALLAGFFGFGVLEGVFGSPDVGGVGASGAIFGLLGILAVILPRGKVYLIGGPLIAIVVQAVLGMIFPNSAFIGIISFIATVYILVSIFAIFSFNTRMRKLAVPIEMPFWLLPFVAIVPLILVGLFVSLPIGNMAHLGGLLAGVGYGLCLRSRYGKKVKMLNRAYG